MRACLPVLLRRSAWVLPLGLALLGSAAPAQAIAVLPRTMMLASGQTERFMVDGPSDEDARTDWSWRILEAWPGGGASASHQGADFIFHAPEVTTAATWTLEVADPLEPMRRATAEVRVLPRLVLQAACASLGSGQSCRLTPTRGEGPVAWPEWAADPRAGTFFRQDGGWCYNAPVVEEPIPIRIRVEAPEGPGDWPALITLQVVPLVTLTVVSEQKSTLLAGSRLTLQPARVDDKPADWQWDLQEPLPLSLQTQASDLAVFTAPGVKQATTLHLWVRDRARPEARAVLAIHVMPRIEGLDPLLSETILPDVLGHGWMNPRPAMTLFAGTPRIERDAFARGTGSKAWRYPEDAPAAHPPGPFGSIRALAFVDDPRMGGFDQHWLVGDADGLKLVAKTGAAVTPVAGVPGPVSCLACARPSGRPVLPGRSGAPGLQGHGPRPGRDRPSAHAPAHRPRGPDPGGPGSGHRVGWHPLPPWARPACPRPAAPPCSSPMPWGSAPKGRCWWTSPTA